MLEIQPEIIHKEGQQYYNSFLNNNYLKDTITTKIYANTQDENNNSNKIATTEYVDKTFKNIINYSNKKKQSGIIQMKRGPDHVYINYIICKFGPNDLFILNCKYGSLTLTTTALESDNLIINVSLNTINKGLTCISRQYKISRTSYFDVYFNTSNQTGVPIGGFGSWYYKGVANIIKIYDLKNNNFYVINLMNYDVQNYDENIPYMIYEGTVFNVIYTLEQLL